MGLWLEAGCKATGSHADSLSIVVMLPVLDNVVGAADATLATLAPGATEAEVSAGESAGV